MLKYLMLMLTLSALTTNSWAAQVMNLRCEDRPNPLGVDVAQPRLSWMMGGTPTVRGLRQSGYRVLAASSPNVLAKNQGDLWDSGRIKSDQSLSIRYQGQPLRSHQDVFWKVQVWDHIGQAANWSQAARWTMGILRPQDWGGAKWISVPASIGNQTNSTVLLRREFAVKAGLKRAVLSICGLGQYEMTLNGKHLTDSLLNPGWTKYDKTCLYDTYDITPLLSAGQNAVGLLLGNGMYRVAKGERYAKFEGSFGPLQAIAAFRFEYNDNSVETVVTDEQWRAGNSPMTFSSIYGGEDWDARKVEKGWDRAGFNAAAWLPIELSNGPGGALKGITHAAPPVRSFQAQQPVSSKEIRPNVTIYDLGQDASYISRVTATGPAGSVVKITPSELLNPDGTLFRNNYNGKSWSQFTLAGTGQESYTSKFFTTGCRYYQVECLPPAGSDEAPKVAAVEGIVVHSDSPFTGEFSCSNELFNRICRMIRWAELANMKSVISDNPNRERLGWLEQDHLHGPSFRYNYEMRPLVGKIISDMADSQLPNGLVPCIAPELTVFGPAWREAIEWGSAGVLLPWQQYEWTGDSEVLRRNYPMMKRYVEFVTSKAKNGIAAEGKGDWSGRNTSPATPKSLVATAFYFYDAQVLAQSARLLGDTAEAASQQQLADSIRHAFNAAFFHPETGQYATGSQTSNAMPLVLGLVDPAHRKAVLDNLVADIENRKYENTTGEVGMRYVLRALADGGRSDVVYAMNNQSEQPGYGYQLKMGATALPETWDAHRDNSQSQFMLGHIMEWFYHDLAGIQSAALGFKKIIIKPAVVGDLTMAQASYESAYGRIESRWQRNGGSLTLNASIPANTSATIYVPAKSVAEVQEGGKPAAQSIGVKARGMEKGAAVFEVLSGSYSFTCIAGGTGT